MPPLAYWLAVLFFPGIGWKTIKHWLTHFPTLAEVFAASENELRAANLNEQHIVAIKKNNWQQIEKEMQWINHRDCHIFSVEDPEYPQLLKEISSPPLVLYLQGNKNILNQNQLAIVGARKASLQGLKIAEQIASSLSAAGLIITSGLAAGIDRASHEGALLNRGMTIGVAGTGLHHVYPATNKTLLPRIIEAGGAILSEFSLNTPPKAINFPRRNRIISGLSQGILVVEAALKSGSLITARHALEQGREVFAIPGCIYHTNAKGCHYLIQQGAKLVENVQDILDELNLLHTHSLPGLDENRISDEKLSKDERGVYNCISHEITSLDVVILRSGLTADKVSSILLRLELHGFIQSLRGGYKRDQ